MLIKVLFWLLVALDSAALLLLFVLGLAAAGSDGSSPLHVALVLLVLPALPLLAAIALFLFARSRGWRALAFVLVAAPLAILVTTQFHAQWQWRTHSNAQGELTFFEEGPMRELMESIRRNDAGAVALLAPKVDVNRRGYQEMTLLIGALRQLRSTPERPEVLYALLDAGADPNLGTEYERPLQLAIQMADKTGPEPVRRLLAAGADPNRRDSFGNPIFFAGTGHSAGVEVLGLLLDHGADLSATARGGESVLISAANARQWQSALLLLERGADPTLGRSVNGLGFEDMIRGEAGRATGERGYRELVEHLHHHGSLSTP